MQLKGKCVLVVDDDPLVGASHVDMLEDSGCQAILAGSIATAWNAIKARRFDAIVLDHDLGDGKGFDLLKLMCKASAPVPACIYLSGAGSGVLAEAAAMQEVCSAIAKPVSKEALLKALLNALDGQSGGSIQERYPKLVGDEEREMLLGSIIPAQAHDSEGGDGK